MHWQRCLVRLCWTDADIPCSPVDYDWYHSNWAAVTLLCPCWTSRPDWSAPLSECLGWGGWQLTERTEKPQRHIKEHQLGSSETFMIPVVLWESGGKKERDFTSSPLYSPSRKFNLAAASWRGLDKDVIHYIYAAPPSRASHRCLRVSHPSCVLQQILRWEQWLLRASQTYAMQLCSIMGDQHLHNLYPSYSLRTNQMLFFSTRVTWIIYTSKIYLFCGSQWSRWLLSLLSHLSFMMERVRKAPWLS